MQISIPYCTALYYSAVECVAVDGAVNAISVFVLGKKKKPVKRHFSLSCSCFISMSVRFEKLNVFSKSTFALT